MSLIATRSAMVGGGAKLPYDAEVEYLESTGTQWIDTGLNYFADFEVGIKLRESVSNKALGTSAKMCMERYRAIDPYWQLNVNGAGYVSSASIVDYHVMSWKGGVFAADGVTLHTVSNPFTSGPMKLFGAGGNYFPNMIYVCKLWDANGVLVRDFNPVRFTNELGQSEGAMYDRVSGQLFRNAGTGSFEIGPDINPISARSYVNDGLIAMWDGIENVGWGTHDPNATVWKDLIGTNDLTLTQYGSFDQNSFGTYIRTGVTAQWSAIGSLPAPFTSVEMCGIKYVDGFIMSSGQETDARFLAWTETYIQTLNPYKEGSGDGSSLPNVGTISGIHGQEGVKGYFNGNTLARLDTQNSWTAVRRNSSIAICGTSGNYEYKNYLWGGRIYNLRLYSRALTAAEIAANYAIDKARFNLP